MIGSIFIKSIKIKTIFGCDKKVPLFDYKLKECIIIYYRGPPCLLQLHLGVVSRERFSGLELIKEYLKNRQVDEVSKKHIE
jgi:hypothetical protein